MPEEFEGDLAGAVFWGADLTGAKFRDVNLTDVKVSHAWLNNVDVDAMIDKVVINGVDVTQYVNERDQWYPLRAMLQPKTSAEAVKAWEAMEGAWATTTGHAHALGEEAMQRSVHDEFSFVETVRHLILAMDKWFTAPVLGETFHPLGLPNKGSLDFGFPNLDYSLKPSAAEALAVRADRAKRFRDFVASVSNSDLERRVDVLENGNHSVLQCVHVVFEEEFWHHRYAVRDLALLS